MRARTNLVSHNSMCNLGCAHEKLRIRGDSRGIVSGNWTKRGHIKVRELWYCLDCWEFNSFKIEVATGEKMLHDEMEISIANLCARDWNYDAYRVKRRDLVR